MTAARLKEILNIEVFNLQHPPPETYEVDAETYANVCQFIFDVSYKPSVVNKYTTINLQVGKNNGIMFKGIELLLKKT